MGIGMIAEFVSRYVKIARDGSVTRNVGATLKERGAYPFMLQIPRQHGTCRGWAVVKRERDTATAARPVAHRVAEDLRRMDHRSVIGDAGADSGDSSRCGYILNHCDGQIKHPTVA